MKQKKLFRILALVLLCLPQIIFARKPDVFLQMKPGDWFEVLVSDTARNPDLDNYRYNVRYVLNDIDENSNKNYKVIFERIRIRNFPDQKFPLGYDSYYPPYQEGVQKSLPRPGFFCRVDKSGKVLTMKPQSDFAKISLYQITPLNSDAMMSVEMEPVTPETAKAISNRVFEAIARGERNWYNGRLYRDSRLTFVLTAATFPIAPNVLIEGSIRSITKQVKEGLHLDLSPACKDLHIAADGSFKTTTFLAEGCSATLSYNSGGKWLKVPLIFKPGDTLRINADAGKLVESLQFSGNAAKMAAFGLELAKLAEVKKTPEISYGAVSFSANALMQAQRSDESTFTKLAEKYKRQLSDDVLRYYRLKFKFEQAAERMDFLLKTGNRSSPRANRIFEGFPADFFSGIDSLPVMMIDYNTASWNTSFLNSFQLYMQFKTDRFTGGSSDFFLGNYVFSLNYLRRFPLYFTLAGAFKTEFGRRSWETAQTLKPYYDDFVNNCGDTALTNAVKRKWQTLANWAPGNPLPLKNIRLADGSLLDLGKFKGRVLCITFNFHNPDEMKRFLPRIRKQNPQKVHFLIVQLKTPGFPASDITKELKKLPQVTYAEVAEDNEDLKEKALLSFFYIKTFVLDASQTIIRDNIDDSPNMLPQDKVFEEAVQNALAPKIMSKEEKAELIKITGWSLGSVLIAGLIFFSVYRARVSAIKRKESLSRRIKELEIKAIRSQMNPHFMFNALNSIQSLINNARYREANIYLEKFSLLMRRVLNNSERSFVSLSDEIEAVALYAELEKLRFDFIFNITTDKNINADLIEIPGMIIQPLVENAILHGLAQKGSAGILEILITEEPGYLRIQVVDNGRGLRTKAEEKNGFGLRLVRERLDLLNSSGTKGILKIDENLNSESGGVIATLIIPID